MIDKTDSYFEYSLYFTVNSLVVFLNKMANKELKELGLFTSHAFLLMMVIEKPGIKQKDLAEALHLSQSTVSRFTTSLATKGYLKKIVEGNRSYTYPTEAAKVSISAIRQVWKNLCTSYHQILGEKEGKELAKNTYDSYKKLKELNLNQNKI